MIEGRGIATLATGGLLIALAASAGCSYKVARFCDEDTPCQDPDLPFCDRTGEFGGIGNQCIPNPFDGDAILSALEVSRGELDPSFDPANTSYTLDLGLGAEDLIVTATAAAAAETSILVNESAVESGSPSAPILLDLGPNSIEIEVLTAGGSTTYTIDVSRGAGILQRAYIKAPNTDPVDLFGDVAISGNTLAVGALGEDSSATGIDGDQLNNEGESSGAVYVFVRSGITWSQQAYIKASNAQGGGAAAGDNFGSPIALSGDTLVVGTLREDSNATGVNGNQSDNSAGNSGAAYVFVRNGTTWSQQAYLKASNTEASDFFGTAVAVDGDTVAVAARTEDSSATGINGDQADNSAGISGAVYVFTRSGTTWSQEAYIKASNTDAADSFGSAVGLSGETLVVGARGEDSNDGRVNGNESNDDAEDAGAVYVFTRNGTTWMQQAYIKATNPDPFDRFGTEVAILDNTLAVTASGEDSSARGVGGDEFDNGAEDAGAVYVFTRSGSSWSQQAYIKASNTDTVDRFGTSLAVGPEILAVSAMTEDSAAVGVNGDESDNGAVDSGSVYLFTRKGEVWAQQAYIKASNTDPDDLFGNGLAISGNTLVVGARNESSNSTGVGGNQADNSAERAGAVYVFE